jgi:hypothetical protein
LSKCNAAEKISSEIQWNSAGTNSISDYVCNGKGNTDNTSGCEAFNDLGLKPKTRNIDIGGGKYDQNTEYLKRKFHVQNYVYDPFNRSSIHNEQVLKLAKEKPFDTATSMSVLNVVNTQKARLEHIQLMFDCLKKGGTAYFKVYPSNGTGKERYGKGWYQSDRGAKYYVNEVSQIFGHKNTALLKEKDMIKAWKN